MKHPSHRESVDANAECTVTITLQDALCAKVVDEPEPVPHQCEKRGLHKQHQTHINGVRITWTQERAR